MDSVKSIVVVAILLGVLYGISQVIYDDDSPVSPESTNLLAEFDAEDSASGSGTKDDSSAGSGTKSINEPVDENKLLTSVTPPPSTFDPSESGVVFPERKEPQPSSEPKPRPENVDSFGSSSKFSSTGEPPFREVKTPRPDNGPPNSSSPSDEIKIFSGTDKKNADPPGDSRRQPTTTKDPRQRFVPGSFSEFEQRVRSDMKKADELIQNKDFAGALKLLTRFYDDPRLSPEENQNLVSWLDPLAGKVIYSVEHHLQDAYFVRPNDSLNVLSVKLKVPPELILNINRVAIPDPTKLVPGTELKMVQGPFDAEISISKKKMTLFVNDLYAGTFRIRVGNDPAPKPGTYRVLSKSRVGQDYTDSNNRRIKALAADNPYGRYYLNLGGGMGIHGTAQNAFSNDRRGCISLNAVDAEDVHNILTTHSTVVIVR